MRGVRFILAFSLCILVSCTNAQATTSAECRVIKNEIAGLDNKIRDLHKPISTIVPKLTKVNKIQIAIQGLEEVQRSLIAKVEINQKFKVKVKSSLKMKCIDAAESASLNKVIDANIKLGREFVDDNTSRIKELNKVLRSGVNPNKTYVSIEPGKATLKEIERILKNNSDPQLKIVVLYRTPR